MDEGDSDSEQEQPQCNPSDVRNNSTWDVNALSEISNTLIRLQQWLEQNEFLGAADFLDMARSEHSWMPTSKK